MRILTIDNKKDKKFLRNKTKPFDFQAYSKDDLRDLLNEMRKTMEEANGVGLSANQVGIDASFFVAEFAGKFYTIFNPEIVKISKETNMFEEGCLSIPENYADVPRASEITIKGLDKNEKRVKMRVWGHLARIFQHETDHLNGKLFTDYIK